MIHTKTFLFALACVATFMFVMSRMVVAQQPSTPEVRALSQKLMGEINLGLQCSTALATAQDQLAHAQAEIKRLTDKYEPQKDVPKK